MKTQKEIAMNIALENLSSFIQKDFFKTGVTYTKEYPIEFDKGSRFIKVVRASNGRSVWGFVEIATGDIYKAATWRTPAKHVRGNIFDTETWKGFSWTGPQYLR